MLASAYHLQDTGDPDGCANTVMVLRVVGKAASGQLPGSQTQPLRAWRKEKTVEVAEEIQPRPGLKMGVQASLLISLHLCCAHRGTTEWGVCPHG